jgi:hypothetical protein
MAQFKIIRLSLLFLVGLLLTSPTYAMTPLDLGKKETAEKEESEDQTDSPIRCAYPDEFETSVDIRPYTDDIKIIPTSSFKDLSGAEDNEDDKRILLTRYAVLNTDKMIHSKAKLGGVKYDEYGLVCMWYESVEVDIRLYPVLYKAFNLSGKKCDQAVQEHIDMHSNTGKMITKKFAYHVGLSVRETLDEIGAYGPIEEDKVDEVKKKLLLKIKRIEKEHEMLMLKALEKMHNKIDTPEELERVRNICIKDGKGVAGIVSSGGGGGGASAGVSKDQYTKKGGIVGGGGGDAGSASGGRKRNLGTASGGGGTGKCGGRC